MKAKTYIQEHYQARLLFRFEGEIKSLIEKQELKEFITTKPALQESSKGILEVEKRSQLEIRKLQKENFHQQSKINKKVSNQPHTKPIGGLKAKVVKSSIFTISDQGLIKQKDLKHVESSNWEKRTKNKGY